MNREDTIYALATPPGQSAIALVRVSGSRAAALASDAFGRSRPPPARRAARAAYRELSGEPLDEVVAALYRAPRSYTGEDTLEISCHGNPLIVTRLLEDLARRGCRQAEPGEFTRRAFLNGRMDLTQAEAVMELIEARSDKALRAAGNQLRGAFGRQLDELKSGLLDTVAAIEAYIDFPEEDLPPETRERHVQRIQKLGDFAGRIASASRDAALLREGVKTLIAGPPNAGKSSLLNRLLGFERAIVSERPGATRDFLREPLSIGPYNIQIMDTAGLRDDAEGIEAEGARRSLELAEEADVILLVLDGHASLPSPALPAPVIRKLEPEACLVLQNKADLGPPQPVPEALSSLPRLEISALTGEGVDRLKRELVALIDRKFPQGEDDLILVNARHGTALAELRACLEAGLAKLREDAPPELVASDLRGALDAIGRILGRVDCEEVLDSLFASFCIGK